MYEWFQLLQARQIVPIPSPRRHLPALDVLSVPFRIFLSFRFVIRLFTTNFSVLKSFTTKKEKQDKENTQKHTHIFFI
jgi:hypothetical protein